MIVVKAGGNSSPEQMEAVCADVARHVRQGEQVVLVHGASRETSLVAEQLGHPPRFVTSVSGTVSRYTDRETLDILTMVAAGRINKRIVERLQQLGANAVGLCGLDGRLIQARRKKALKVLEGGKRKVLRGDYSGRVEQVNAALLHTLLDAGYAPVIAPLAISPEGQALNVDGDRVAAAIAIALQAQSLVILSNVPGLLRRYPDESTLIEHIAAEQVADHIERHAVGPMKKKLLGALEAVQGGVRRAILADGREDQPLTRALCGNGTVVEST